jgi:hypothetical protein
VYDSSCSQKQTVLVDSAASRLDILNMGESSVRFSKILNDQFEISHLNCTYLRILRGRNASVLQSALTRFHKLQRPISLICTSSMLYIVSSTIRCGQEGCSHSIQNFKYLKTHLEKHHSHIVSPAGDDHNNTTGTVPRVPYCKTEMLVWILMNTVHLAEWKQLSI